MYFIKGITLRENVILNSLPLNIHQAIYTVLELQEHPSLWIEIALEAGEDHTQETL